jgi:hypothetical protein
MKGDPRILMSLPSPLGKPFFFLEHPSSWLFACNMGVARFPRKWQGRADMGSGSKVNSYYSRDLSGHLFLPNYPSITFQERNVTLSCMPNFEGTKVKTCTAVLYSSLRMLAY